MEHGLTLDHPNIVATSIGRPGHFAEQRQERGTFSLALLNFSPSISSLVLFLIKPSPLFFRFLLSTQLIANMSGSQCSYDCAEPPEEISPYTDITVIRVGLLDLQKLNFVLTLQRSWWVDGLGRYPCINHTLLLSIFV